MGAVGLHGVSRRYGSHLAADDISLQIDSGEFVVLLGPSGCGKTTTLNMIAGLDTPTAGTITIAGREVEQLPPDHRDIAMVFQSIALYPHLSAYENIAFPLRRAGVARAELDARVRRVAAMLKVEELLQRRPHQLSGGQRQRVAIGRAAVREPAVFLFDEPLSSLDAKLRVDMRVELKRLHERLGTTFVYVTHDQVEAMTMADRIAVMNGGRVMQFAAPREIYRRPANSWVAAFVGSPAMNMIEGRVSGAADALCLQAGGLRIALPPPLQRQLDGLPGEGRVTLGIRPEAVRLAGETDAPAVAFDGEVVATEPVGSDLFVDVGLAGAPEASALKLRTHPDREIATGDRLDLRLPEADLYLFGPDGSRLHPGTRSEAAA